MYIFSTVFKGLIYANLTKFGKANSLKCIPFVNIKALFYNNDRILKILEISRKVNENN